MVDLELLDAAAGQLDVDTTDRACSHHQITLLEPEPIVDYVHQLYGFDRRIFGDFVFLRASRKHIRLASRPLALPRRPQIDRVGLEFLRIDMATPRMTTVAAMTWAADANRNVVDTSRDQCLDYLRRDPLWLDDEQLARCTARGFVLIRHASHGLGVGFLESTRPGDDDCGRVRSMYPRAFCRELEQTTPFGNPR